MTGEALLIGIATVAVVVAGFAAVAPGIAPDAAHWTAGHRIRLHAIVSTSFNVTFEALLPVVLFPAFDDERGTMVVASSVIFAYLLLVIGVRFVQLRRAGALRSRPAQLTVAAGFGATALFGLNAVVFVSPTAYGLALLIQLAVAAITFYSLLAGSS